MTDLLKVFIGAVYAWAFPSALALGLFWLLVVPALDIPIRASFDALPDGVKVGILVGGAAALGLLLNALSTPLYRVLEGYLWPGWLQEKGVKRQQAAKQRLLNEQEGAGWRRGLLLGKIARFPQRDDQIAPTRLGNALRAMETYGKTRFNFDSQTMWNELWAAAPQPLRDEIDRSRASTDFCVALVYLSLAFAIACLAAGVADNYDRFVLLVGSIGLASSFGWYRIAIASVDNWRYAVRALVNIGRVKVADALSLSLPVTLEDERRMWGLVTAFVYFARDSDGTQLDAYRKTPPDPSEADGTEEETTFALHVSERIG